MSQPCGRFCSIPARYRTYLRASPLICLADSISILMRLGYHFIASFQSKRPGALTHTFKYRLASYLRHRFESGSASKTVGEELDELDDDHVSNIEKLTWLRWLFFGFGTLGPGLKLMAMKGIYWTKVWGGILLVSFVIVEILIIVSWNRKKLDDDFQPAYDWYNPTSSPLRKIDRALLGIACMAHLVVMFWLIAELWPRVESQETVLQRFFNNPNFSPPARLVGRIVILSIEVLFGTTAAGTLTVLGLAPDAVKNLRLGAFETAAFALYYLSIFGVFIFSLYTFHTWLGIICTLVDVLVLAAWAWAVWLVVDRMEAFATIWPRFGESLQITTRKGNRAKWAVVVEREKLAAFTAFLFTLILTIVWYAVKYDGTGTESPKWTAVFG